MNNGKCLNTIKEKASILSVSLYRRILASASLDDKFKIWNVKTGECLVKICEPDISEVIIKNGRIFTKSSVSF